MYLHRNFQKYCTLESRSSYKVHCDISLSKMPDKHSSAVLPPKLFLDSAIPWHGPHGSEASGPSSRSRQWSRIVLKSKTELTHELSICFPDVFSRVFYNVSRFNKKSLKFAFAGKSTSGIHPLEKEDEWSYVIKYQK